MTEVTEVLDDTQSQPQTQTQTQSQTDSQELKAWGRLLPATRDTRTLGLSRSVSKYMNDPKYAIKINNPIDLYENFSFGRSFESTFCVKKDNTGEELFKGVSKDHFFITRNTNEKLSPTILHDLSQNGTFVNKQKVGKNNRRILENNDVISVTHASLSVFIYMDLQGSDQGQVPPNILEKYFISHILGQGASGTVRLIYNKMTCEKFAMKIINKFNKKTSINNQRHPDNATKIMNEFNIMKTLKHPFVISTYDMYDTPSAMYITMEVMEEGELFDLISRQTAVPEQLTKFIFYQIVLAVGYLHQQGITHRDLKPENVMLKYVNNEILVKLTDFGMSKFVDDESYMKTMCGTPLYVAPEVILSEGQKMYDSQVDVWSLGVILFICLFGYLPFSAQYRGKSLKDQILTATFPYSRKHWQRVTQSGQSLVKKLLVVNPNRRLTIDEILRDPWMMDQAIIDRVEKIIQSTGSECYDSSSGNLTIINLQSPSVKRNLSESQRLLDPPPKRRKIDSETTITSSEDTTEDATMS